MSDCEKCGRDNGHWLGCQPVAAEEDDVPPPCQSQNCTLDLSACICGDPFGNHCGRDGCTNERAVSKGPRPAKYCEDHKTGSKK